MRTRCGLSPRADHTRCTVAGLTPTALAIDRQLRCVSPAGVVCWVSRTISSIFSTGMLVLRPRPERTLANLVNPSSSKRDRHAATLVGETPSSAPLAVLALPADAINSAFARVTSRRGDVRDLDRPSRDLDRLSRIWR